jgi:hypothetical protein
MSEVIIPSSPTDKQRIKDAMVEISNAMTRIEAERDFIKDAVAALEEDVGVPKKYIRKMAKIYHKQNLNEVRGEMDDVEALYESTIG